MCIKRKTNVGKIYKTTDGKFNNRPNIKKGRRVVAVHQRKDDNALAVTKLHSMKNSEDKRNGNKDIIPNLALSPEKHSSLTKNTVVEKKIIFGFKVDNTFYPIKAEDLTDTQDRLTNAELRKVKRGIQGDARKHRKNYKRTLKKWKRHFSK